MRGASFYVTHFYQTTYHTKPNSIQDDRRPANPSFENEPLLEFCITINNVRIKVAIALPARAFVVAFCPSICLNGAIRQVVNGIVAARIEWLKWSRQLRLAAVIGRFRTT